MKNNKTGVGATVAPLLGGFMLAVVGTSEAEARSVCDTIDLSKINGSVAQAFRDCLLNTTPAPVTGEPTPEMREIESRGCDIERDRATNTSRVMCIVVVPQDVSCPVGTDNSARMGNIFDPKKTIDGRSVGSQRCYIPDLIPVPVR